VLLILSASPVLAEKRVALVIGNSSYKNVSRLVNPVNDAAAIAKLFKEAGFDLVDSRNDLGVAELRRAIRDFSDTARDADVAVVYFAGHGIEVDGSNYLIPVDAVLERDIDVDDETLSLDRVTRVLDPVKRLRLVILDACRDTPFTRTMRRTLATRSIGRGLARVEPTTSDTLIAFAAKAGSTASDGGSRHSPFTAAILKHIAQPGLDLRIAFGRVRDDVLKATGFKQEPFVYGSLGGSEVWLVPPPPVVADPNKEMRRDYELAAQIGTKAALEAFLAAHPVGLYPSLARAQLAKLLAEEARAAEQAKAAELAKIAEQVKAAERAKALEQAKAAGQAEQANREEAAKAAERLKALEQQRAAELAEQAKAAERAKAAEQARAQAEEEATKAAERAKALEQQKATDQAQANSPIVVASAPTVVEPPKVPAMTGPAPGEIAQRIQTELKRLGCFSGSGGTEWNSDSQRALASFNKHAGTKFDVKVASLEVLDAIRNRTSRVCPLACERGYHVEGDRCVRAPERPATTRERANSRQADPPRRTAQPRPAAKPRLRPEPAQPQRQAPPSVMTGVQ